MIDIDNLLEKWCDKKGINSERIPHDIWNTVTNRTENDIEEFLKEKNEEIDFVNEWAWLEIEQNLDEHPEWKLKEQKQ